MNVIKTDIEGVVIIEPRIFPDSRGYFFESYNKVYFAGQISPLGVRAALSSNFNMFAEVGFGAQGVAQVGFSLDL